jgi:DNA-binding NarL/FixJ family response regulator
MNQPNLNLKVMIIDPDFYALRALYSYVAWDRRTRVVSLCDSVEEALKFTGRVAEVEYPDVIVIDPDMMDTPHALRDALARLRKTIPQVSIMCLAHRVQHHSLSAALDAGVRAYLLRNEVGVHLVSAIVFMEEHPAHLIVSRGVENMNHDPYDVRLREAKVLPKQREFPEMSERIRQALWLSVVEGMSAQLAADEMGVSEHTIRSYIKEGYKILKSRDDTRFPDDMSPEEQAFMRFTALDDEEDDTTP